jgi:CRP/FNR family cyclic AMP-dependent transcriptional regulator
MGASVAERAGMLEQVGLFAGLEPAAREAVAERLSEADFAPGDLLVREGDAGTGLFVIVDGTADVIRDGHIVATLGPGEFVGELSVLDRRPRLANVIARTPVRSLALASWDLESLIRQDPAIAMSLLRGLAGRLRSIIGDHHRL